MANAATGPAANARARRTTDGAGGKSGARGRNVRGLGDALDCLLEETEGKEKISLSDALEAFGSRAFGPLILVPAILLTLPTGALPGVPIALGAVIAFVCLELLLGRRKPAIPGLFGKLSFSREGLEKGREGGKGVIGFIDGVLRRRLDFMLKPPMLQVVALVCIGLCLMLIPLEIIPFATAIPGTALILLGLAVTARDGLLALIGVAAAIAGAAGMWLLVF
jgi:hypothetical protein